MAPDTDAQLSVALFEVTALELSPDGVPHDGGPLATPATHILNAVLVLAEP